MTPSTCTTSSTARPTRRWSCSSPRSARPRDVGAAGRRRSRTRFRVVRVRPARPRRLACAAGPVRRRRCSAATSLDAARSARASTARTLVGVSLGGMVAMWMAIERTRARRSARALPRPRPRLPDAGMWRERAAAVARQGGTAAVADAVLERWFTPEARDADPARAARMRSWLLDTPAEGYAASCEAIDAMDLLGGLPRSPRPRWSSPALRDPATPPEHAGRIAAGIPGARLASCRGAATSPTSSGPSRSPADPRAPARPTTRRDRRA